MRTITNLKFVLLSYFYHYNNYCYHSTYLIWVFKTVYIVQKKWTVNKDDLLSWFIVIVIYVTRVIQTYIRRCLALALLVALNTDSGVNARVGQALQRARARIRGNSHIDNGLIRRVKKNSLLSTYNFSGFYITPPPPPPPYHSLPAFR